MLARHSRPLVWNVLGIASAILLGGGVLRADADPAALKAQDQELFGKFDNNRDGKLSKEEIGVWSWARYDKDQDAFVTAEEFLVGRSDDRKVAATDADDEKVWKLLDWNNDDRLSGTELDLGMWSKYDSNKDGKVEKQEFLEVRKTAK